MSFYTNQTGADQLVSIEPPLPCVGSLSGPGFVVALGKDRLIVKLTSAAPASDDLTIAHSEGQTFKVSVHLSAKTDGTVEAAATSKTALHELDNLLALVRKGQHIQICETMDVEAADRFTGFSDVLLRPRALPELAWDELDTSRSFLGRRFPLPLLITGMTGGLARGADINARLAAAAQEFGLPMGVGSQRIALEHPEHARIFTVKKAAPKVFLIGNLGISQLRAGKVLDDCKRAVDMIDADALAIHVNVLQEVIQVEGDRDFRRLLAHVGEAASRLGVPVLVKEVGCGVDVDSAVHLYEAGVRALDVGGKGGTSWSFIEGVRAQSDVTRAVAQTFRDFGIPTAFSLAAIAARLPKLELVATGGLRDGLTVAKALGLGANMAGVGLPLFRAALQDAEAPFTVLETLVKGLKTAMIVSGSRNLAALSERVRTTQRFREQLADFTL